jgi:hypothetical protein
MYGWNIHHGVFRVSLSGCYDLGDFYCYSLRVLQIFLHKRSGRLKTGFCTLEKTNQLNKIDQF